jgi:hypothetical protein
VKRLGHAYRRSRPGFARNCRPRHGRSGTRNLRRTQGAAEMPKRNEQMGTSLCTKFMTLSRASGALRAGGADRALTLPRYGP